MKNFNRLKKYAARVAAVGVAGLVPVAASASSGPYDAITSAVDWSDVTTGIGAIAALVAAVLVVKKGAKMLLGMIGR